MKVQIKEFRTGRVKSLEKRYADILVKLKQAEYYEEPRNTYQTKVMTPAPLGMPAPTAPAIPAATPSVPQEPLENPVETVNNNGNKPKHRGRPRKNNYETKVMTAEE